MALLKFNFFSTSLLMQTEVNVIMPQKDVIVNNGENYKCLYLLHGLSDNYSIWLRRTSIERYADKYGICVVMPSGGRSFYFNQANGENYYDFIAKELPQRINEFFKVSNRREDRYIAGVSMGGYGAIKIALKECDSFCAAAGLSSVADIKTELFKDHLNNLLNGNVEKIHENDLYHLIKEKENEVNKPRLYSWCGTEDFLYKDNIEFKTYMEKYNYDFTYRESSGDHGWEYWDKEILAVLEWMLKDK